MSTKRKVLLGVLLLLVVIQFFPGIEDNPESAEELDFIHLTQPPAEIAVLLKSSCYDCHSHHTIYPWYSYIAPVSWLIAHDVKEGRMHLNFSEWGNYRPEKADHKLEECYEEVEEGEMPMNAYVQIHREAALTNTQKKQLSDWFRSLRQ